MFGLTEFDVILDNTEVLSFTYDIKISKTVVQSSKSHHVNISDILVAIGGENVFGVAFDKFVKILEQHKQRPISIKFRRKISVAASKYDYDFVLL
jgi:C-terminal processing protease CtpA/Prc